jgi:hypothetical protein
MAFADTIALYDDAATPVSHDFVRVGIPSGGIVKRLDSAASLSAPRVLLIGHSTTKPKTGSAVNRHLSSLRFDKQNATSGLVESLIVNVTIQIPQTVTFVSQDVYDAYKFLDNLHSHANIDKILRGEQ